MNTKKSALAIVVAVVLLSSLLVGMASAAESQNWYLTDAWPAECDTLSGDAYNMPKGSGAGTGVVNIPAYYVPTSKICVANEAAGATVDMSGDWDVTIKFENVNAPRNALVKVEIGSVNCVGGYYVADSFIPVTSDEKTISCPTIGMYWWTDTITSGAFSISTGRYLAIRVTNRYEDGPGGTAIDIQTQGDPTNSPSYISSPDTDPGYPVPELSTIVLMSVGMLMLGGFVVYSRRRNNK